ncbi:nicotinamide-nucleotide amidase [Pedobacter psychrotolerans]|uniref:CinA-like protein n=1 Tax=Pedobacter psychrotolerans TaxID=1843235 RepID=A0A4R2HFS2_9SPHI|nr:competence/damage-inducible protein A [Pedobacter psychrotolerans]TCO25060.1 nicotinamide-nucleotide amidase [Pedobacter psychrotolerans]GGE48416.1 CinA-like protein [Pedobacter psychrotolerans]
MLAEIITIGDEILIGQIVDTNSAWMAKQLNLIGVSVKQITSVSDDESHILASLTQAQERADLILITGGLGPTKDDITKKTLAKYFDMGFRRDEGALEMVTSIFKKYNRPLLDINVQQADVPDGCEVIVNKNGTAPCMWFEHHDKIFISMPGVPYEMMYLMDDEILPRIKSKFILPSIVHKTILTANIGESFLAKEIEEIEDQLPQHIKLAYLPKLGQVRLRLSASGANEMALSAEVESYAKQIMEKIPKFVVVDEDIPFEKAVLNIMKSRGLTLSTAESCTGGYIAHLITQHPGCSSVYWGGAVAYAYELKESILGVKEQTLNTFGAVSEETVTEMAEGAIKQFKTDYSIAVSGIAGPDGGTADKPVGTVWIAVSNKNKTIAKVFTFSNKRIQNIERSAASALTMLLNLLKEDGLKE